MIRKPYLEKADVATAERSHKAYQRRSPTGKPEQIRQKGAIVKERQELEKPDTATSLGADHKKFTELLDGYFKNQSEMKMLMSQIDTHKEVMESKMKEIRPMLSKFENIAKAEEKFKTEFKDGDWEYKFLSFTRETKPYKDLYTKAFNLLTEIQRDEMKKAEQALSQITGQEKFTREPLAKALRDLVKSYVGKPLTEEAIAQFRRDALSLILLKAAKKATGADDKEYEKDKEETAGKKPLKEKKPVEEPEEDDEELGEAHQQLLEALKNLIAAKESGLLLLKDFFGRKKETAAPKEKEEKAEKKETKKESKKDSDEKDDKKDKKDVKKEKSPEKGKDKDDEDDEDTDPKDRDKKKGKKKTKKDEDDEDESRKSLVDIVKPIVLKRMSDEIEKAKEQKKVDDFLESFEKWEKSLGGYGGARVPLKGLGLPGAGQFRAHKLGREETKAKKRREKEEKDLMKARSHKYLRRLGMPKQYHYIYDEPKVVKEFPSKYFSSDNPADYEKFQTVSFGSGPDVDGFRVEGLHNGKWHSIREFGNTQESKAEKFQEKLEQAKEDASLDRVEEAINYMDKVKEESGMYEGGYRLQPTGHEGKATFDFDKMKRLIGSDRFLAQEFDRFKETMPDEKHRAEVLFNTYVLDDSVMQRNYEAEAYEGKTLENTTHEERMEVAKTILDQMGGAGKIKAMTGAKNFTALPSGVSFDFPNRKGPNHVKITLTPMDTYTVDFYKKPGVKALMSGKVDLDKVTTPVSTHTNIYFDQLKDLFEKKTGLYLSLGVREGAGEYGGKGKSRAYVYTPERGVRRLKEGVSPEQYKEKYPNAISVKKPPSMATMEKWSSDGIARALDGCKVEPDGHCEHGKPSWLLALGYI